MPKHSPLWDPKTGKPMKFDDSTSSEEEVPLWDGQHGMPLVPSSSFPYSSSSHVTGFQMPASGSSAYTMMYVAPVNNFSHYFQGQILVGDLLRNPWSYQSRFILTGNGTRNPIEVIRQIQYAIGRIVHQGRFIATAVVIARNTVITARHAVNNCKLGTLEFFDEKSQEFYSLLLLEDGSLINEDYVIFRLISKNGPLVNPNVLPAKLSKDIPTNNEWFLCLGYIGWVFYAQGKPFNSSYAYLQSITMGQYNNFDQSTPLKLITQAMTIPGFSGAPYINSKGEIIGIHLKSTQELLFEGEKTGLLFSNLVDPLGQENSSTSIILTKLFMDPHFDIQKILSITMSRDESFDEFSTLVAGFLETDEGRKRKHLFGNTPCLTSNTGIAVLKRTAQNQKAKYNNFLYGSADFQNLYLQYGEKIYKDHKNWTVYILKEDGQYYWIPLNTKDPTKPTKAGIQMGHIVSVVKYWNQGNGVAGTPYYASAKSKWTGAANRKNFSETVSRPFMTDSTNYQFEWCRVNEANGMEEEAFSAPDGYPWIPIAGGKWKLT